MTFKSTLASVALVAGMAAVTGAALPAAAQTTAPGAEIVEQEEKIDAFVAAAVAVAEVRNSYLGELESATDEAEQATIIEAANSAIVTAIEATPGISVDEYIAIGDAAAADPELNNLLNQRFAELHGPQD